MARGDIVHSVSLPNALTADFSSKVAVVLFDHRHA